MSTNESEHGGFGEMTDTQTIEIRKKALRNKTKEVMDLFKELNNEVEKLDCEFKELLEKRKRERMVVQNKIVTNPAG